MYEILSNLPTKFKNILGGQKVIHYKRMLSNENIIGELIKKKSSGDQFLERLNLNENLLPIPYDKTKAGELAASVSGRTMDFLETQGQILTDKHKDAIQKTSAILAYSYYAKTPKRTLIPLFAGGGKTQTVIYHVTEILERKDQKGIWISVNTLAEIREISESLQSKGISAKMIGTRHSKEDSNITVKSASSYPVVLSTHERIRSCEYSYLMEYKQESRQLIWDEALISTESIHLNFQKLSDEIHRWESKYEFLKMGGKDITPYKKTKVYFDSLREKISKAEDKSIVRLPPHPGQLNLELYSSESLESLEESISESVYLDKKSHMFHWNISVPDKLDNIIILDASGSHRQLQKMDSSIHIYPLDAIKDYSNVNIHYCKADVGKTKILNPKLNTDYYHEIKNILLNRIPQDKKCVCFHVRAKDDREDPAERLKFILNESDKERIIFNSWGRCKGINSLSDYEYAFHLGMSFREQNEMKTAISAQKRNYLYETLDRERHVVQLSEHVDLIYQGINRLKCRKTVNGEALKSEMYLFYPNDEILSQLEELMPNIKIKEYEPEFLDRKESGYILARKIITYLLDYGFREVTIDQIKKDLSIKLRKDSTAWTRARYYLESNLDRYGYCLPRSGRKIIRL